MIKFLLFTFTTIFSSQAENFRAPAVLDGSCNLNIPTTITFYENGSEVVKEKDLEVLFKEQCQEVRKCMNSADDEEMLELKRLEEVACHHELKAITTSVPAIKKDTQGFDGKRTAKEEINSEGLGSRAPAVIPSATAR